MVASFRSAVSLSGLCLAAMVFCASVLFSGIPSSAKTGSFVGPRVIIGDDRGGALLARVQQIRSISQDQSRVEIRGRMCFSSCTLLLGLPDVCVLPTTVFGFHGPSYSGAPLPGDLFERVSGFIASHYPEDLRPWYLQVARHKLQDVETRTGADLIAMGIAACESAPEAL